MKGQATPTRRAGSGREHASDGKAHSHDGNGIIVEDGRDVFRGELVGGVADEQARLADGTVTDDDTSARVSD